MNSDNFRTFTFRGKVIKSVTGIGSRKASRGDLRFLYTLGRFCAINNIEGWTGSAPGSDMAFETGYLSIGKEGFHSLLPDDGFSARRADGKNYFVPDDFMFDMAFVILKDLGVVWLDRLDPYVKKLYGRNVYQILRLDMRPVDLVVYTAPTTKKGKPKGGTAIAVMVAEALGIPTINLAIPEQRQELKEALISTD